MQSLSPWHCVSELQVFTVVFPWYGRWIGPTPVKGPQDCAYHHRCSVAPAGCLAQFLVAFGPSVPSHFSGFWSVDVARGPFDRSPSMVLLGTTRV